MRAKLDSGSSFCVFQRLYADLLGLETEQGVAERIRTTMGASPVAINLSLCLFAARLSCYLLPTGGLIEVSYNRQAPSRL